MILDLSKSNDKEKFKEYLSLRESIQNRILELDSFFEMNFDKPYIYNFEAGRLKLKKLLIYEPENISEVNGNNENKKYILAGYDKISEEGESEIKYKESKEQFNKENDIEYYNENETIEEISNSNNSINFNSINNINNRNINQPNKKKQLNNINKNSFFDEYNNKIKKKNIKISPNIKNKIRTNINPLTTNLKSKKITINYNNYNAPIKQEQKNEIKNLNIITQNNNDKEESINKIEEGNADNNCNTLSLNSFAENTNTDRNDIEDSFKNKKNKYKKKSYRDSLAQNNMQVREVNIKFVLTKEEYAVLMKEKAKNHNILNNKF